MSIKSNYLRSQGLHHVAADMDGLVHIVKVLTMHLEWSHEELESWLRDQGDYGTTGYEEMLPIISKDIKVAINLLKSFK